MARSFSGIRGRVSDPAVAQEYESAERFDKVRVGETGVFFPYGFSIKYLPYRSLERVFIRIHEVNGKLCCGKAVFQYFRLVFMRGGKEFIDVISENEAAMDAALAAIREKAPQIAIGFAGTK
jgi:hypothetical protein